MKGILRGKRVISALLLCGMMMPLLSFPEVHAEGIYGKRTFKVTAYYSPLPDQSFYTTGSYEAEKRLNGEGVRGASGREVFPGMIAAPKSYPFGTKIQLDGLGVGTVTDRGGAIVDAGVRGQSHDRLDIWMGSGEEGLRKALKWGVRIVDGEVFTDKNVQDTISVDGVALPPVQTKKEQITETAKNNIVEVEKTIVQSELENSFPGYMGKGASGEDVALLQVALYRLGYMDGDISGSYDEYTIIAMLRMQLQHRIVEDEDQYAAGYFGIASRVKLLQQLQAKGVSYDDLSEGVENYKKRVAEELVSSQQIESAKQAKVETTKHVVYQPKRRELVLGGIFAYEPTATLASTKQEVKSLYIPYIDMEQEHNYVTISGSELSSYDVRRLQIMLRSLGYFKQEPTGIFGPQTKQAIIALQAKHDIGKQDGVLDVETQKYMEGIWTSHVDTWGIMETLKKGDSHEDVSRIKAVLERAGFPTGPAGTLFTQEVEQALLDFQLDQGVISTSDIYGAGIAGPITRRMLNKVLFKFL